MTDQRRGLVSAVEADVAALHAELSEHMRAEDLREKIRAERDEKTLTLLEQLATEHAELMREWRESQERKRKRSELWGKVQASVIGWAIVGLLAWLTGLGVAVFEHVVRASTHLISGGK